jgi:hypothetical protein
MKFLPLFEKIDYESVYRSLAQFAEIYPPGRAEFFDNSP